MLLIVKSIVCINLLSFITAQTLCDQQDSSEFHDDGAPIIDPLRLILNSADKEGIFYCNSRINISQQRSKLVATIEKRTSTSPTFRWKIKQINQTTIRIVVIPNGYIGISRIICHWENNITYGQTADLIIASNPGVIILKEPCRAYDRRYVECILDAPIIARAFQNGFTQHYSFSELSDGGPSYRYQPKLVSIVNASKLVFHFEPLDRNVIPAQVTVSVNMTLSCFDSSVYQFTIKPIHTTNVAFQINDVSNRKFTIRIDHNNTGGERKRLCSGHVSEIDDQKTLVAVQDIPETIEHNISIDGLRSGTKYKTCLRCFYERNDKSFKDEECRDIETLTGGTQWIILLIIAIVLIIIIVAISLIIKSTSLRSKCFGKDTPNKSKPSETMDSVDETPVLNDYHVEDFDSLLLPSDYTENGYPNGGDEMNSKYQHLEVTEIMQRMTDKYKVSPDTIDLSSQENAC